MKTTESSKTIICLVILNIILLTACNDISREIKGEDDSMNGGFEKTKNGLPVNWYFTPKKLPKEGFSIIMDTTDYREGRQSMKIINRFFSSSDSAYSPGFFQAFHATGGETYKISFWMKNQGSSLRISTESAAYMKPGLGINDTAFIIDYNVPEWRYYEYHFTIPPKLESVYFSINIFKPGTVWFDDIQIIGTVKDKGNRRVMRE